MAEVRDNKSKVWLCKVFLATELEIIFSHIPEIHDISKEMLNPHYNHLRGKFWTYHLQPFVIPFSKNVLISESYKRQLLSINLGSLWGLVSSYFKGKGEHLCF